MRKMHLRLCAEHAPVPDEIVHRMAGELRTVDGHQNLHDCTTRIWCRKKESDPNGGRRNDGSPDSEKDRLRKEEERQRREVETRRREAAFQHERQHALDELSGVELEAQKAQQRAEASGMSGDPGIVPAIKDQIAAVSGDMRTDMRRGQQAIEETPSPELPGQVMVAGPAQFRARLEGFRVASEKKTDQYSNDAHDEPKDWSPPIPR